MTPMATAPRTFKPASPPLHGDDVRDFQRELTHRFAQWTIDKEVADDGDYGPATHAAAKEVCIGLGLDDDLTAGVTADLRVRIRHPETRTPAEQARADGPAAEHLRAALRAQFKDVGGVIVAPGANKPGQPLQQVVLDFVGHMAQRLNRTIVITTGTNHRKFASPGVISEHFTGHAADMGMIANHGSNDGPVGDEIMAAALVTAGKSPAAAAAQARAGGLINVIHGGMRIQCIWKAPEHHDHVHVGIRPA